MNRLFFSVLLTALSACNYQGDDSSLDPTFRPGITVNTPFTAGFDFVNSSQYSFDSSKIDFTNGLAELTAASQIDNSSQCTTGFGDGVTPGCGGTSAGTTWDAGFTYLRLDHTGTPTNNSAMDSSWTPKWASVLGLWHLDEAANSGSLVDSSGKGNSMTVSASGVTLGTAGKLSSAGVFDGVAGNTYTGASSTFAFANTTFSVSFWFNTTGTSGFFMSNGADPATSAGWGMGLSSGTVQATMKNTNNMSIFRSTNSTGLNDGNWHHVVAVITTDTTAYTNNTATLYVDGILNQSSTMTYQGAYPYNSPLSSRAFGFGARSLAGNNSGGSVYYAGSLDEVAIWNTALQPADVQVIYSRQSAKYAGSFTSRIMDGYTSTTWSSLSWTPTLPFYKELPDNTSTTPASESSTGYPAQSSGLLTSIAGLWHLDGVAGPISAGTVITDSSGNGENGVMAATGNAYIAGKLGQAIQFNNTTPVTVPTPLAPNPCASFSTSLWINSAVSPGNNQILGKDGKSTASPGWMLQVAGGALYLRADTSAAGNQNMAWTGTDKFFDGSWHHVAFTVNNGSAVLYKDGVRDATGTYTPGTSGLCNSAVALGIGAAGVNVDEVAIWNRILTDGTSGTPNEIRELYRRGANRIKYQIQTCSTQASCSASPNWMGPDGTNQTYFSELNTNSVPKDGADLGVSDFVQPVSPSLQFGNFGAPLSTNLASNQYFQYRAILESDDAGTTCNYGLAYPTTWCSPELQSVSVGPAHYNPSAPTIVNNTGVSYTTLSNFMETVPSSGCPSGTLYNLSPDNVNWYYWTGAAWGLTDGTTAQATLASTVLNNLNTFSAQAGSGSIYFKVFLQSTGSTACAINHVEIDGAL